jgi:hypothetical protein
MEGKFQLQSLRSDSLEIRVMVDGYYSKDFVLSSAWDNVVQMDLIQNVEIVKVIHLQGEDTSEVTYHASDSTEEDQFEERFDQIEKPRIKGVVLPDTNSFYVIVGSALDYDQAYRIWSLNKPNFPSLQIIQFGDRMYRVGFIAGSTELDAVSALRDAIDMKSDAWLIRPGTY